MTPENEVSAVEIDLDVYLAAKVARIAAVCDHALYCVWSVQVALEHVHAKRQPQRFVDFAVTGQGETL